MLCGTGQPPALLGVLGIGEESGEEWREQATPGASQHEQHVADGGAASAGAPAHGGGEGGSDTRAKAVEVQDEAARSQEGGEKEEEVQEADADAAAAVALRDMPEGVLKAAKECAVYEDVSGVITAVYSARYDVLRACCVLRSRLYAYR